MRARYRDRVERVKAAEAAKAPGKSGLAEAVARYLFKLMAYKDEYEVARLYTDGAFLQQVANELGGDNLRFEFHLAPPLLARSDPATGEPRKITLRAVDDAGVQAAGAAASSCAARRSISSATRRSAGPSASSSRLREHARRGAGEARARQPPLAVGLAAIPEKIRGFGHVKMRHLEAAKADEAALLEQFRAGPAPLLKAAE